MYHSKGSLLARLKTEKNIPSLKPTTPSKRQQAHPKQTWAFAVLLSQKTHASESVHAFVSHTCRVKLSQLGYELSVGRNGYLQLYFEWHHWRGACDVWQCLGYLALVQMSGRQIINIHSFLNSHTLMEIHIKNQLHVIVLSNYHSILGYI